MGFESGCQWCVDWLQITVALAGVLPGIHGALCPLGSLPICLNHSNSFSLSTDHDRPRRDSSYKAPDKGHPALFKLLRSGALFASIFSNTADQWVGMRDRQLSARHSVI